MCVFQKTLSWSKLCIYRWQNMNPSVDISDLSESISNMSLYQCLLSHPNQSRHMDVEPKTFLATVAYQIVPLFLLRLVIMCREITFVVEWRCINKIGHDLIPHRRKFNCNLIVHGAWWLLFHQIYFKGKHRLRYSFHRPKYENNN